MSLKRIAWLQEELGLPSPARTYQIIPRLPKGCVVRVGRTIMLDEKRVAEAIERGQVLTDEPAPESVR